MSILKSVSLWPLLLLLLSSAILMAAADTNSSDEDKRTISWRQTNDNLAKEKPTPPTESFVILHEQQDPDESLLGREFEHLKTFLANNMPAMNPVQAISSWITTPMRRLWSRRESGHRSVMNDTINAIYNRLIDYGFHSVGISDSCRELAICNTSNYILTQMPAFLESYGRERLMNFPTSVFGNHDYTNAWIVGLSSAEPSFCPSLFACDNTVITNNMDMNMISTEKIPIQVNQQTAYYMDASNANNEGQRQPPPPLMLLIEVIAANSTGH